MNKSVDTFTWIPLYKELAIKLSAYRDRQSELIQLLEDIRTKGYVVTPLNDQSEENGDPHLLQEIDPFTFFGTFNRGIRNEHRNGILSELRNYFGCDSPLPNDFSGIPIINNQQSWFIRYKFKRSTSDTSKLWEVFQQALGPDPLNNKAFLQSYDNALEISGVNVNLSMGLFWIRPDTFLSLDGTNRAYLEMGTDSHSNSNSYIKTLAKISDSNPKSFFEISHTAYEKIANKNSEKPLADTSSYWLVNSSWNEDDRTSEFLENGIWVNRQKDGKFADLVSQMKVGEKIALKFTATQKYDLPFEANGKTVSRMTIKARGTIVKTHDNGNSVEVEWESDFKEKQWYFYTLIKTVWQIKLSNRPKKWLKPSESLLQFVFHDQPQDYEYFRKLWKFDNPVSDKNTNELDDLSVPYGIEDIINDGVFMPFEEIEQTIDRLKDKKNLILQGTPGVGKTFIAEKLAFALMQESDKSRVKFVQFHQSYTYEDFVRGYRPLEEKAGTFGIQDGVFFNFCNQAREDERPHVLIIDEINRGNLSQIFGELLMLIEKDKRSEKYAIPLMYTRIDEPNFYVPDNLYIIGMMNLADRSLALVDYALRRRFAFKTLEPAYQNKAFRKWLSNRSMPTEIIELIIGRITELNETIAADESLGNNYTVGHSYFCPSEDNQSKKNREWFNTIVDTEILPLLTEYWFDNYEKLSSARSKLLAP